MADQLKQHGTLVLVAPYIADIIDQQQGVAIQPLQCCRQGVVRPCFLQLLHQGGGGIEAAGLIQADQGQSDAAGDMGLADIAGAKQQQVLSPLQPAWIPGEGFQLLPAGRFDALAVVIVGQGFGPRQVGVPQQPVLAAELTLLGLLLAEGIEKLAVAPALSLSLRGEALPSGSGTAPVAAV